MIVRCLPAPQGTTDTAGQALLQPSSPLQLGTPGWSATACTKGMRASAATGTKSVPGRQHSFGF